MELLLLQLLVGSILDFHLVGMAMERQEDNFVFLHFKVLNLLFANI